MTEKADREPATVALSLVSHTNVGKTTLARTLLRRDVGEVMDRAHVTEENEVYRLLETGDAVLELWDTPGFGDSARLMERLRGRSNPLGWFLSQVWDRVTDRPFWCGQRAVANVREHADAVLYLVNASEHPAGAGYVRHELELLTWVNRPVLLLLNQTGLSDRGAAGAAVEAWRHQVALWPIVRDVLPLDAFTRCWVQEGVLLARVGALLGEDKRAAMAALANAWMARHREVFRDATARMGRYLAAAAADREALAEEGRAARRRAMESLGERLESDTRRLMDHFLAAHGLDGTSAAAVDRRLESFLIGGKDDLALARGAVVGGMVSGALGGLAADLMAGGLTFGGGLVAGAILGALGGAGLTRGYELIRDRGEPAAVRWSPLFLDRLARQTLLRYLAVAHYGRGRGPYEDAEFPAHWGEAVEEALARRGGELTRLWKLARRPEARPELEHHLTAQLHTALAEILTAHYPEAAGMVR